jgi:2-keto-4-pentenoate hydratase/2-oxohepta-3-ene-1,7-dioic acid hydratase in catechol pathway
MKLATFERGGRTSVGLVHGNCDKLFNLTLAAERIDNSQQIFVSVLNLIDAGQSGLDQARRLYERGRDEPEFIVALGDANLLAPMPEPRQMRDFMVFETHIKQAFGGLQRLLAHAKGDKQAAQAAGPLAEVPAVYRSHPTNYITNRFSVVGPNATVRWPRYSKIMDYELELGMVTGKRGAGISLERAHEHIFGYTIFNDFSARDTQTIEMPSGMGPGKAKSFDTGNGLGPWIVTADEIEDPYSLTMTARVNGETRSVGTSAGMLHTFEQMIAHVSRDETVQAGEVFGSGTVGNGSGLELDRFLNDGDVIELEIEKIGVLRNRIVRQDIES